MTECTHHWTVTSECPMCLRIEVNRLRELLTQEPVAWISPDGKLLVMADAKPLWPDATIPLYTSPVGEKP